VFVEWMGGGKGEREDEFFPDRRSAVGQGGKKEKVPQHGGEKGEGGGHPSLKKGR